MSTYENMTYEELVKAMLDKVTSDVDKREGSLIFDAVAPCAFFLTQQKFQLVNFIDLLLPDTALGEYLDRVVSAYGIERKAATPAVRKMVTSAPVELGTRWGIDEIVYAVTDQLDSNQYEVTCETAGDIGNQYSGAMSPVSNGISGVTAELTDILTAGTDEEKDVAMRERFYTKVRMPATSGNAYHYQQWALEVPGTGAAKVFPLDDGPGTVTVLVVDDDMEISSSLPDTVADYIETVRPIGATVTVESPAALTITISANVVLDGSREIADIKADYEAAVKTFLKDTIFTTYRVSYARLSALLLDVAGVEDFDSFQLNSGTGNVMVEDKQIPVLGTVSLTEVDALGID